MRAGKKPASTSATAGGVFLGGGWHESKVRGTDGVERDPTDPCDVEIAFTILAPISAPENGYDDAAKNAVSCAIANDAWLKVTMGRTTVVPQNSSCRGSKDCSGSSGDLRLFWNSSTDSGPVIPYVDDKPSGPPVGTFLRDGDHLLWRPVAASLVLERSGFASCTGP
ncbi:MAG: hypothetical protein U0169_08280 [Polyangiaceae bacterium]